MKTFEMVSLGSPCVVSVAFIAQFRWEDGTIEYMKDPSAEWTSFGITEQQRDDIIAAMTEHKTLHNAYTAMCDEEWANYEADCRASGMEPYSGDWKPSMSFEEYLIQYDS